MQNKVNGYSKLVKMRNLYSIIDELIDDWII